MAKTLNRVALIAVAILGTTAAAQDEAAASNAPTRYTSDSPVAPSDRTDQGWNRDWSLNFSLNNVFTSGSILSNLQGYASGDYYLSEESAVRVGIALQRSNTPVTIAKTTVINGNDQVSTYSLAIPGTTDSYSVAARGEYLKRLGQGAIAPYFGGGLMVGWTWNRLSFTDDITVVDQRTQYNNSTAFFDVGATGLLGAEWRLHPQFAFFAEYGLSLSLFRWASSRNETTVENTVGGVPTTVQVITESVQRSFLNLSAGLNQGGSLGLRVMF